MVGRVWSLGWVDGCVCASCPPFSSALVLAGLAKKQTTLPPTHPPQVGRNICHGSDSVENAEREIKLWFGEGTLDWTDHSQPWVYE